MRRRAETRVARAREPLAALHAVADSNLRAAALEMKILARRAVGMQHDDEVREPAALLARATRVVRVLDERDYSITRRVHRCADGHSEIQREALRAAMAELRAVALDD